MRASSAGPSSGFPFSVAVEWSVTTSDCRRSSSRGTSGTPISWAFSTGRNGSWPRSFASKARQRDATREPTWPRPTMPTVLPASSEPTNFDFSQRPCAIEAAASGTRRRSARSTANVCSTAETTLPVGELRTMTPRAEAAGTSTLSTPTPARPTTVSFGAAAKRAASTFVALRTSSASASFRAASSSSREAPAMSTTSCPALRRSSSPALETFSATMTRLKRRRLPRPRRAPRGAVEGGEVHVSHVPDAEGRRLPLSVTAADREPALLDLRDEGLRGHAGARLQARDGPGSRSGRGRETVAALGGPGFDAPPQGLVAGPAALDSLLQDVLELNVEGEEVRRRGRVRRLVLLRERLGLRQAQVVRAGALARAGPIAVGRERHAEARRKRQGLLRPREREVEPPRVALDRRAGERGHDVAQEKGLRRRADRPRDRLEIVERAGRSLRVDHRDGLVRRPAERLRQLPGVDRTAPGNFENVDREPEVPRAGRPALGESARRYCEHALGGEVQERGLPEAGRGRGRGEDELLGAENPLQPGRNA